MRNPNDPRRTFHKLNLVSLRRYVCKRYLKRSASHRLKNAWKIAKSCKQRRAKRWAVYSNANTWVNGSAPDAAEPIVLMKCLHILQDSLIRQSLDCNLIPYLMKILDSRMEYTDNPSMVCHRDAFKDRRAFDILPSSLLFSFVRSPRWRPKLLPRWNRWHTT